MAVNLQTPQPSAPKRTAQETIDARRLRRDLRRDQEICQLQAEVLSLKWDNQQRDQRIQHLEQIIKELLTPKPPPRTSYTDYMPIVPPAPAPRRVTRPLGDIDQWTTVSEIPSVKLPAMQPTRLDVQVAQAAAGHFDLYSRHANVAYLNARNLEALERECGIRDMIWCKQLIELRCDASLDDDQILCVTEEDEHEEITQKKPVVNAHVS